MSPTEENQGDDGVDELNDGVAGANDGVGGVDNHQEYSRKLDERSSF